MIWNRLRYVKDPETGKRVSRLNPESAWIITDVPELRIISDALWQRVKDRQQAVKRDSNGERPFWDRRRPRYLLSKLVTCGCCGGGYTAVGRTHLGCAAARDKGTCDNKATIKREVLEDMILGGLRHHLMAPELFAVFCDEFTKEFNRLNREKQASRSHTEAELHKVERSIRKLIAAIKDGIPALTIKDEMIALEARKQVLQADLAAAPSDEPLLHPNMSALYRRKVRTDRSTAVRRDPGDRIRADPLTDRRYRPDAARRRPQDRPDGQPCGDSSALFQRQKSRQGFS